LLLLAFAGITLMFFMIVKVLCQQVKERV